MQPGRQAAGKVIDDEDFPVVAVAGAGFADGLAIANIVAMLAGELAIGLIE